MLEAATILTEKATPDLHRKISQQTATATSRLLGDRQGHTRKFHLKINNSYFMRERTAGELLYKGENAPVVITAVKALYS